MQRVALVEDVPTDKCVEVSQSSSKIVNQKSISHEITLAIEHSELD